MNSPEFFKQVLGSQVLVKLVNGNEVVGFLEALDGGLNVILREMGKIVFIRGNNIYYLTKSSQEGSAENNE